MDKVGLWVMLEAKPGREKELEDFLISARPLAMAEAGTTTWYALKIGPSRYGIFDTFADEHGRKAHLGGEIAKALFSTGREFLANDPQVEQTEILAAKAPGA